MPGSRFIFAFLLLAAIGLAVCGCALLKPAADVFAYWPASGSGSQNVLPPIQTSRDAMQIDIIFLERPVGDPLLGKSLWADVDTVGAVIPEERDAPKKLGLRVGNAGANPCAALERMLKMNDPIDAAAAKNRRTPPSHGITVLSEAETPIKMNFVPECALDVPIGSEMKQKTYKNFQGVLKMTTHRLQDGWARVEFVPEIQHGATKLRPLPTTDNWQNSWQPGESPEVESLWAQRFSVKLHVGEMIIITAAENAPLSFGHYGFISDDPKNGPIQRVLVVRLSQMARIDPVYAGSNLPKHHAGGK